MKLKYSFAVREVAGQSVALALGEDTKHFNGMIKLNSVGEYIFRLLENDISEDEIVDKLTEKYDVSAEDAKAALIDYLSVLRQNNLIAE